MTPLEVATQKVQKIVEQIDSLKAQRARLRMDEQKAAEVLAAFERARGALLLDGDTLKIEDNARSVELARKRLSDYPPQVAEIGRRIQSLVDNDWFEAERERRSQNREEKRVASLAANAKKLTAYEVYETARNLAGAAQKAFDETEAEVFFFKAAHLAELKETLTRDILTMPAHTSRTRHIDGVGSQSHRDALRDS